METLRINHESFQAFVDFSRDCKQHPETRSSGNDVIWSGAHSLQDAARLAATGWPEGLARIKAMTITTINEYEHIDTHREIVYVPDDPDGNLDMGRYMSGEPEVFQSFQSFDEPSPRIIRILINRTVSGGVRTETLINTGCHLMALIDAIESRGTRCEVGIAQALTNYTANGTQVDYCETVLVKRAHEPLDRELLVYAIAHPAAFRWLMMSSYSGNMFNHYGKHTYWGNGNVCEIPADVTTQWDIVTPKSLLGEINERNLSQWLATRLSAFGLELK